MAHCPVLVLDPGENTTPLPWELLPGALYVRQAWDLGLFAAVLAPENSSLQATKYKETIWAKNKNIHGQLGQILDKRYKETKKTQVPILKRLEQKQGNVSAFCTQCLLEVVGLPRPSLRPYPHPR